MKIDFTKGDGLVPVIIQNANTLQVLMLGYMDEAAYAKTSKENRVTFGKKEKETTIPKIIWFLLYSGRSLPVYGRDFT